MECINPVFIRKSHLTVRCGKCLPCLSFIQEQWSVRLSIEFKKSVTAYFCTLTYDDDHINECEKSETGYLLTKSHLRAFLGVLRNYCRRGMPEYYQGRKVSQIAPKPPNFKYFAVGEYGHLNNRPHWHLLLFNVPYNHPDLGEVISFIWDKGFSHVGIINEGAIDYCTDYLFKNDRKKVVRSISNGIGLGYITPEVTHYHQKTLGGYVRVSNNVKKAMPRYYKERLFTREQREQIGKSSADYILDQNLEHPEKKEEQYRNLIAKIEYKNSKKLRQ